MPLVSFLRIRQVFRGAVGSDSEREELFREALLLTLARATSADVNINPAEVEAVQRIMQTVIGDDVSAADIRVAAASELYEDAPLNRYLAIVGRSLSSNQRATIVRSLAEVIKIDRRVSPKEVDFFNWVVAALAATPAEIAGLIEDA